MARFITGVLFGFLLAGCETIGTGDKAWPDVECPTGSGVTAAACLADIEGWAATGSPAAKAKAAECRKHTGVSEVHRSKLYVAWTAAKATRRAGLTDKQKAVLWAVCSSELTHDTSGADLFAVGLARWPDVECPLLSGIPARQRLDEIIGWAELAVQPQAKMKAVECRDTHTGVNDLHCERVYAAWVYASTARNPELLPEERDVLWLLCVSELTHDTTGGGRTESR